MRAKSFLLDPSVSRAHAIVEFDAGEPVVRDLDSTNGTYVNGRRGPGRIAAGWRRAAIWKYPR